MNSGSPERFAWRAIAAPNSSGPRAAQGEYGRERERIVIDLTGQVALVTGGSRGIGRGIALRLAQAGADVVLNFVQAREEADRTAEQIAALGRRVAEVQADVSEPEDIQAMLEWIGETFGRLNVLVSTAVDRAESRLLDATPERFTAAMNTNARALILLVQSALPWLRSSSGRGKVVAISDWSAAFAAPGWGLRGASKAAMESAVRHLALELGTQGINVNAVQVGTIDGDARGQSPQEFPHQSTERRSFSAEAVADAVLFLASPLSDFLQGQTLVVDGGLSVGC
jgi:enoyl-[acyl-carrier protein] reductase III